MKHTDPLSASELVQDAAFKHERQLVYCRQMARPVLYQGFQRFIAGAHLPWGETEMHFYLTGSPDKVRPCELTIPEIPK